MPTGLTSAQVAERVARGEVNVIPGSNTRSWREIIRANFVTRFNMILGSLLVVILIVGPINDALFGFVLVINIAIGIIQEWRSKATLDRLTVLNAPKAHVLRDDTKQEIDVEGVVLGDTLWASSGYQIVVDGEVCEADGLEIDESLLTGESHSIKKMAGDPVMSGSVVVAGSGFFVATAVGPDSYAAKLASEAKRFELVRSELRTGIERIVTWVGWAMIPVGAVLIWSQFRGHENWKDAVRSTVGGLVAMVPEGLVLLTSLAFAAGIIRLGRRKALVQQLAAVETLARVDVLCLDKTGTITSGEIRFVEVDVISPEVEGLAPRVLASMAHGDPAPNATVRCFLDLVPAAQILPPVSAIPFSSARKWSAMEFAEYGTFLLGAPEMLLASTPPEVLGTVNERMRPHAEAAHRVVLLALAPSGMVGDLVPLDVTPIALGILEDDVRADAPETLAWFSSQGVDLKVISGDNPVTVAAIAQRAGLAVAGVLDMRSIDPSDADAIGAAMLANNVFGRVTPQQKKAMVIALKSQGRTVAMTGDGVNDVLALKEADMGIAMGNGSDASRATAQLVLLDSRFSSLPATVREGRRVITNIERVAQLFVTKTAYSILIALVVGITGFSYPFLPRHLTLIGSLTIGIPSFFLALEPTASRAKPGFSRRVARFAVPAGAISAACVLVAYGILRHRAGITQVQARTGATIVLLLAGFGALARAATPLSRNRLVLLVGDLVVMVAAFALPWSRRFYALRFPSVAETLALIAVGVLGGALVWLTAPRASGLVEGSPIVTGSE